jgi:hypothetical protein
MYQMLTKPSEMCILMEGQPHLMGLNDSPPAPHREGDDLKKHTSPAPAKPRSKFARGPTTFKKTAAARFIRGVMASGLPIASVECNTLTGTIRVIAGRGDEQKPLAAGA